MAKKDQHYYIHQIAAALFSFITLVHAGRLMYKAPVTIGTLNIPLWFSVIGGLIAGSLAILFYKTR